MKEILSPIGNPDRKWKFFNTQYLHVEQYKGEWIRTVRDVEKPDFSIAEVEVFHLDNLRFRGDNTIGCAIYNFFGKFRAVQRWGLVDDIKQDKGSVAVLFGNKPDEQKWILAEAGDRFSFITNPHPPFHTVHLTLLNNKSSMKRTITIL